MINVGCRTLLAAVSSALLLCTAACSTRNSGGEVMVVDGCMVGIKGISAERASEIVKSWDFGDDCAMKVNTESGEGAID